MIIRSTPIISGWLFLSCFLILVVPRVWAVTPTVDRPIDIAPKSNTGATLALRSAIQEALANNPQLARVREQAQAMGTRPSQVGALPDPWLILNAMNLPTDTYKLDQEPMTQLQIGFQQVIPFPGKRRLRKQAAQHDATAAATTVKETRLRLIRDVKISWWKLYYLERALEIIKRNQVLLRQFVKIAQTKYKVGRGLMQDVLLAQVEASKLINQEIIFRGLRRKEEVRLMALLSRKTDKPIRLPYKINSELPKVTSETILQQAGIKERPLLEVRQSQISAAQTRLDLARKNRAPDFRVGLIYGYRQGTNPNGSDRADFTSIMFGIRLPLYSRRKQHKAIEQRGYELNNRHYALLNSRLRVQTEISRSHAAYTQARDQTILLKSGIIPQTRQTVDSMLAGYQVNKVDFLNLVRAQITLYNYETQYWMTLSMAKQAKARLAAAIGKETIDE